MEFMKDELSEPVSPTGECFNSSVLSISNIIVLETEVPIDDSQAIPLLKDVFLPINPRFSSIMVSDKGGRKHWKRVKVNLENHVNIPIFPSGMPPEFYDKCFDDYLSKITAEHLPQSQPLWDIHIIKYPTSNAAGNLIFKIHQAIGDGYSLMGALLSCLQRAENPSLPLTFPSVLPRSSTYNGNKINIFKSVPKVLSSIWNTVADISWSIKSSLVEDDETPIRSGDSGVEFRPVAVSTTTFSLADIKQIKADLGVTVNDVITAIVFLGTRLYMKEMNKESSNGHSTALVLLNTRMFRSYKSIEDMLKPNAESPWGNHIAYLHITIPKFTDTELFLQPLDIVKKAHEMLKIKKSSSAIYFMHWLLEIIKKVRGPEAVARYYHTTLRNTSMAISNMIGPVEKMALANHPLKGMYFVAGGSPQNLFITILSYMGTLRVAVGAEKDFIDTQKLKSSIERAFEVILKAACKVRRTN